jgi:hypothetical protein
MSSSVSRERDAPHSSANGDADLTFLSLVNLRIHAGQFLRITEMEAFLFANAAITLALLLVQLFDFVTGLDRVPLSRGNVLVLAAGSTAVALSPAPEPHEQYDRAA